MEDRYDVLLIGGGIVGLATAYRLLERVPGLALAVLEKEPEIGQHQTGHNSGVLHAGLYYAPGSRKARLCREGKAALEAFAADHGIPFEHCGKLVVALSEEELPRLQALKERGMANGVEGLEEVGPERMRAIEPYVTGVRALWSPKTGIIDYRRVACALAQEIAGRGGRILTGQRVTGITPRADGVVVRAGPREFFCRNVISCAGLHSDRIAAMTDAAGAIQIVPFRGSYYTLRPQARHLVRGLIYPVPDPRFPFLGVHFTRTINGEVLVGPNAVLAFAREGYRRTDCVLADLWQTVTFAGFRRLARRHWRTGLMELWRDWSKPAFAAELARFIPQIRPEDLLPGPSGVRAQAVDMEGNLVDDFAFGESPHVLHVRNAPSPAATASLAIGRELAEMAIARFSL
ncbi:MAG: L-2-hydroxyglutarate oxidase [Chloroherpetonaceae bacterium]|nr:L-2-hydroxyglutarate oxidase [Chthonomonadaceae bacterium]MDW8206285.1 L-2-hydroxyglutarate oxidase [Chloroherpetonaceae bacterium]